MTKDQLEEIIRVCLSEVISNTRTESEKDLIIGFMDNLRKKAEELEQSDHFVNILKENLEELKKKQS